MIETRKSILFVDDDPEIISSTRRFLHTARPDWQVTFANSGMDALQRLKEKSFDVVVTDIRMPGISGIDLLEHVQHHYPQSARIALSGHTDRETSLRISGLAHQFLVKPCPIETIIAAIQQTLKAGSKVLDEELRTLIARLNTVPSQPATYLEIVEELKKDDPTIGRVGEIISRDPSMSAKILQLVNSPFFGLPQTVVDPRQATVLLGSDTVRDLVLTIGVFSQFESGKLTLLKLDTLWDHSQRTGLLAKAIALKLKANPRQVNDALIGGLVHDVGKLILADNFPRQYKEVNLLCRLENKEIFSMERRVFGADHAQVGAYLFGLWGLSGSVQNAVANHHQPLIAATEQDNLVLLAVHAANVIDYQVNDNQPAVGAHPEFASGLIHTWGVESQLESWKNLAVKQ